MKRRILCALLAVVMLIGFIPISASAASNMSISDQALEILKSFEGFRSEAYWDYHQWSIGYGTSCKEGEYPDGITEEKAEELLLARLAVSAVELNKFADKHSLTWTQGQFDALMLFTYNCGEGWMSTDGRFRQSVINGDTGNEFVYNMCLWSIAGTEPSSGLLNRRLCEADMYLNGYYSIRARDNFNYVILNAQGGTLDDRMQGYISGSGVMIKPVPVRSGYRFMGWYTQAEGGQWVTGLNESHDGMTLYAHWQSGEGSLDGQGEVLGAEVSYQVSASACVNLNKYAKPNEAAEVVGTMTSTESAAIVSDYVDDCGIKWGKTSAGHWLMLGSAVPSQTITTEKPVTVTVTNEYINVRRNPGVGSDFVGTVLRGEKLNIVRTKKVGDELWGKFSEGWVSLKYTDYDVVLGNLESEGGEVIATGIVQVNDYLRIRQGAGTQYAEVGRLLRGDKVNITKIVRVGYADWGRIEQGWICMDYVKLVEEEEPDETQPDATEPGETEPDATEPGETEPDDSDTNTPDAPSDTDETVLFTGTVVNTTSLRVRSAPGTKNAHIGNVTGGQKVKILEKREVDDAPWGRISSGWICLLYVQPDPTAEDLENAKAGYVTSYSPLNIRSAPGAHNTLMGTLKPGTVIAIYEQTDLNGTMWGRTDMGWVSMKYVTLDDSLTPGEPMLPPDYVDPDQPGQDGEVGDTLAPSKPDGSPIYTGSVYGTYELRVRTGPGTNYAEITRYTLGVKVNIYEIRQVNKLLWGKIDNGWVCLTYVELDATPENFFEPIIGTVSTYTPLKIRTAPGVYNPQVGLLTDGDKITIYDINMVGTVAWGRMDRGWVCMDYVILPVPVPGTAPEYKPEDSDATEPGQTTEATDPTDPGETTEPTDPEDSTEPEDETTEPVYDIRYTGKVILTNSLRVREGAGTHNRELGRLTLGTKVEIFEVTDVNGMKWGHISKGWISLDYVEIDATEDNARYTLAGKVTVANTNLKIRKGPGVQNDKVGELTNGTKITIYEIQLVGKVAWGRMDQGWVCLDYVILSIPDLANLPEIPDSTQPNETEPDESTEPTDPDETTEPTDPDETTEPTDPEDEEIGPDDKVLFTGKLYNTNTLKVYKAASAASALVATMKAGDKVELYRVVEVDGVRWGRTLKGWVKTANVQVDATKANVANSLEGTVVVGNTPLKIRAGAGIAYTQLGTLSNGTKITVHSITMVGNVAWGRIDQGWVCLDYVILQVPNPALFSDEPQLPVGPDQPTVQPDEEEDDPETPDADLTDPAIPKEEVKDLVIEVTADTFSKVEEYPNLESVNFLNSTCYQEIVAFMAANPDVKVSYKVDLGETSAVNTSTALTLMTGKFDMEKLQANLEYLPDVQTIHIRKTNLTSAEIQEFAETHEQITVTYSIAIGDNEVRSDVSAAELQPGNLDYITLCEKLVMLPKLNKLHLRNTNLLPEEITAFAEAFPGIELTYTVYMYGQEVASNVTKINLANLVSSQVEAAAARFELLPDLAEVELVNDKGISNLKVADVKKLMELAPDMKYSYSFNFFGTKVDIYDEEVRILGNYIGDEGEQEVRDALSVMQNCSYFLLDDCGISNEVMASIRDDFRGTTKVVWRVYFASHKDQPNFPRNALSDATVIRSCYGLNDSNWQNLIYFEDVEYIDFGHNETLTKLDFITYMPKLKFIILSGSAITNLDVFENHQNLEFIEVVWCTRLTDISALGTCPKLKYLNFSYANPNDVSCLEGLDLEMLSCVGNTITYAEFTALKAALPDCLITYKGYEYGEGWRTIHGVRSVHEVLRQEVFAEFLDGK